MLESRPMEPRTVTASSLPNGGNVPFVLRRVEGTEYHKLIGECYVHGIMYGSPQIRRKDEADVCII